ncbi:MAG: hypothetical protein K2Q20_15505, partial [Phycisphaerales bacterium]|nr:hypothetical protein [Phycisphaerales bacterium]
MNRFVCIVPVVMVLAVAHRVAFAQETLSDVGLGWSKLFTVEDVNVIDKAAKLSPEQRQAAEDLMQAGMTRALDANYIFNGSVSKIYRSIDDDKKPEKMTEAGRAYSAARRRFHDTLAPIERDTLKDVRDLLTAEQAQRSWPAYERYRRSRVL